MRTSSTRVGLVDNGGEVMVSLVGGSVRVSASEGGGTGRGGRKRNNSDGHERNKRPWDERHK
jgi:hypothetical protein